LLCRRDELADGQKRGFEVGGSRVVLCRRGDAFFALRDICPHHGARLSMGVLNGTNVESEVGEYVYGRDGEILRCPRHGWEIDITSGRTLHDPAHKRVRAYRVVLDGDNVLIEMGRTV
jgi:nitrite reductase/ring-hydroxylating ferredoxin subunit